MVSEYNKNGKTFENELTAKCFTVTRMKITIEMTSEIKEKVTKTNKQTNRQNKRRVNPEISKSRCPTASNEYLTGVQTERSVGQQ